MSMDKKIKILLIGASVYKNNLDYSNLSSVENDVSVMRDIFTQNFDSEITSIVGEDAKSLNVSTKLKDFFVNCSSDDTLILYWAGHGDIINSRGYLLTYDSTCTDLKKDKILMQDLNELIQDCNARSTLVIVDCCHSGLLARNQNDISNVLTKELDIRGKGKVIITATNDEKAYDVKDKSSGMFTSFFLDHLQNFINDQENDELDVTELYSSVVREMEQAEYEQVPCLKASLEGRFILRLKAIDSDVITKRHSVPILTRGRKKELEKFEMLFDRNKYLDDEHFIKEVRDYINIPLQAGYIESLDKHILKDNLFILKIEWFTWVNKARIFPCRSLYTIELTREQAEYAYKFLLEKNKLIVTIRLFQCENNIRIKDGKVNIIGEEIEIQGIYSIHSYLELKNQTDSKFIDIKFSEKQNILLTMDNKHRIGKWDMNTLSLISSFDFKLESEEGEILNYHIFNDSIILLSFRNSEFVWSYYEYTGESQILYKSADRMDNVYHSEKNDFFIFYNFKNMTFVSKGITKNVKLRKSILSKKELPLIKEIEEDDILIYYKDSLFIYDKEFILKNEESLNGVGSYDECLIEIVNKNLMIFRSNKNYKLINIKDRNKPKLLKIMDSRYSTFDHSEYKIENHRIIEKMDSRTSGFYLGDIFVGDKLHLETESDSKLIAFSINYNNICLAALTNFGRILVWK